MASQQQQMRRESKTNDEVTHFESLTVMDSGTHRPTLVHHVIDTMKPQSQTAAQKPDQPPSTGQTPAKHAAKAAAEFADETTAGVAESMEGVNAGVSGIIEATAKAAEAVGTRAKDVTLDTGKTTADYVGKGAGVVKDAAMVGGRTAAEFASDTKQGVTESIDTFNSGVATLVEGTAVGAEIGTQKAIDTIGETMVTGKDIGKTAANVVKESSIAAVELASETMEGVNAGVGGVVEGMASATEKVAQKTFDTVMDVGKKGATYIGEKAVAGKDVSLDAGLVAGWSAAELASETATGVTQSMEALNAGVGGLVEATAFATEKMGQKGATYVVAGKDVSLETGKATAGVVKDAGVKLATDTAVGVTESMEALNAGVAGLVEATALATEKGAGYIGEKAVAGKDITLETGKATAEYVKDAALVGGWSALELASDTSKGVRESMDNVNAGVEGFVERAAVATEVAAEKAKGLLKDVAVDMGKRGATYIGEKGVAGGKTTAEYAAKVASGTAAGVTESMKNLDAGVAGLVEGTALCVEDVAQKTLDTMADAKKGASYVGEKAVTGALEAGKTSIGKAVEVVSKSGGEVPSQYVAKPKNIVVEKQEEIITTLNYDQTKNSKKETKKG